MNKFLFEGDVLRIHINPAAVVNGQISFTVEELWTEWSDWMAQGDNSKYPLALRSTGGDPIGGGMEVGTYIFLRNDLGWRGKPPEVNPCTVIINGSFYGEDPLLPVMENLAGQETDLIINRSSMTTAIQTSGATFTLDQIAEAVWNRSTRDLTQTISATVDLSGIPSAVWSYITRELTQQAGLSPTQEAKIDQILLKLNSNLDANIKSVNSISVSSPDDFKADVSGISANVNPSDIWNYANRSLTQPVVGEVDLSGIPSAVWSYVSRELTQTAGLTPTQETTLNSILSDVQSNGIKVDAIKVKTDKLTFDLTNHLLSYIEDKAGFSLTSSERTAIANEVEAQIINETDSEKVLTAITDKIASVNPSLGSLTTSSIASAVWNYVTRSLTVASGLTPDQSAKLDDIYNDVNWIPYNIWNYAARGLTTGVNITEVNGTNVSSIYDFRADLNPVLNGINNIPTNVWGYNTREVTNDITLDPAQIWNYPTRSLTDKSANITQVNGQAVTIESFKTDLSNIPYNVWTFATRTATNMLSASDVWNYTTRKLTENNANIVKVNGVSVTSVDDFKADLSTIPGVDLSGIPLAVWTYGTRTTTSTNELTPAAIWNYSGRSLDSTVDANIVKVNNAAVTSTNDFKATIPALDTSAIANAVWTFTTRGLNTTVDSNIISVNNHSVSGPDDFKALIPDVDLSGIPYAVWNYANRHLTDTLLTASQVWAYTNRSLTNKDANIISVNGTLTTSVDDFKADVSGISVNVDASEIWNYPTRTMTSYPTQLSASDVWSYNNRTITDNRVNVTQVNGQDVTIDSFKTDLSLIPGQVWSYGTRTFTNTLSIQLLQKFGIIIIEV